MTLYKLQQIVRAKLVERQADLLGRSCRDEQIADLVADAIPHDPASMAALYHENYAAFERVYEYEERPDIDASIADHIELALKRYLETFADQWLCEREGEQQG